MYDFVEKEAPEGSEIYLGLGEKDASDKRYDSIDKFAKPRNIKTSIKKIPPQDGGISGKIMRGFIKDNDKVSFFIYFYLYPSADLRRIRRITIRAEDIIMVFEIRMILRKIGVDKFPYNLAIRRNLKQPSPRTFADKGIA